ncbi:MAG TPA: hypothetical protein VN861_03125 [Candidatus Acidoferrales bacterium]|nr:hypothetical protein [Candidatus Acidoferrales bacterium]
MTVSVSDISRVTIDYMFRDRNTIKSMLLCVEDREGYDTIARLCSARGMDVDELMAEALKDQQAKRDAFRNGKVGMTSSKEIKVPFTYKAGL